MNETPLLSFITVNYNGWKDTCELIESIQQTVRSVTYEIMVVDNASQVNEAAMIQQKYPTVKTIRSEQNLGFAGGNNLALKEAQGRYFFLINNDAYLEEDTVHYLIERLESHRMIGGVSPKIRFAFPPQAIQYAGYTPLSSITLRNQALGCGQKDDGSFDLPHPTPFLHGAAMMVKREIIKQVCMMPEVYFLYYEELDWSTLMTEHGYELWYEPGCTVFHKESQSTGQTSYLRTFFLTRNRLLYGYRNRFGMEQKLSLLYQMTVVAGKSSLLFARRGRFDLLRAVWKGIAAFIGMPHKIR